MMADRSTWDEVAEFIDYAHEILQGQINNQLDKTMINYIVEEFKRNKKSFELGE